MQPPHQWIVQMFVFESRNDLVNAIALAGHTGAAFLMPYDLYNDVHL